MSSELYGYTKSKLNQTSESGAKFSLTHTNKAS